MTEPIFFQLVQETGDSGTSLKVLVPAFFVDLSPTANCADFVEAVHNKNAVILSGVVAGQLSVYKNKESYENKEQSLHPGACLKGLGNKDDALYVIAPQGISLFLCLLFN